MTVCVCVCILKNGCVRNPFLCYVFAVRDLRKRGGRIESRSQKRGTVIASGGKQCNYKDLAPWVKLQLCLKWFGFLLFIFWGFFFKMPKLFCYYYFVNIDCVPWLGVYLKWYRSAIFLPMRNACGLDWCTKPFNTRAAWPPSVLHDTIPLITNRTPTGWSCRYDTPTANLKQLCLHTTPLTDNRK